MPRLRDDLLAAVTRAPDDDAPRLVAADYLTERGDPWGELIVLQCQLARATPDRLAELRERERTWKQSHLAELEDALGASGSTTVFGRGFVECIGIANGQDVPHVAEGLRGHPVRKVWIHGPNVDDEGGPRSAAVADSLAEWLSTTCLDAFSLTVDHTDGNHVSCAPDFFERLAASERVRDVRSLSLDGEHMMGPELSLLLRPGSFSKVETLAIATYTPGMENVDDLIRCVRAPRPALRELDLSTYWFDPHRDGEGVPPRLFERSPLRLKRLLVGMCGPIDPAAWSRAPVLASLSELHFHIAAGDPPTLTPLLESEALAHIPRITLFSWDDGWDAYVADLRNPRITFEQPRTEWDWLIGD